MLDLIQDSQIQQILNPPNASPDWQHDLNRLLNRDLSLNRRSAGENSIKAFQRLMIFLGYSTASSGGFLIDGDFGRGSNRGLAQFQFEHGLAPANIKRTTITYECSWSNARQLITKIPDVELTIATLERLLEEAKSAIDSGRLNCGNFDEAIFHLNALQGRNYLNCKQINERYGRQVETAVQNIQNKYGYQVQPEWILAIIRQETQGVVRPRFEQHWFSKLARQKPDGDLREFRFQAMSFGLGQILGVNYKRVNANSAFGLYTSSITEQIEAIGRFLTRFRKVRPVIAKTRPTDTDFRTLAYYYNGSGYARHHYHERIASWFREFKKLRSPD